MKKAFTMLELVFVIVVIGILSAIAIPKFAATRDDAYISRARSTVAALRNAVATERQKRILRGDFSDIDGAAAAALLEYGLNSDWSRSGDTFTFTAPSGSTCAFKVENNKVVKKTCGVSGMSDL
jgi:general secretion pathway protein G